MKIKYKIITLLANFAFITLSLADYENYDGRVVYHQDFSSGSYKYSSWIGTDARVSNFRASDLTNANFTNALLDAASFSAAILTNANFSSVKVNSYTKFDSATIDGTNFSYVENFTSNQLYSTLNYKSKKLSGIGPSGLDMSGWKFAG